ncbi:MAG: cytochrome-c peroxidase [Chitinophagaceae bacterium]
MLAVSLANFFCKPDKPSLSNPLQQVIPSGFPLPAYQFSDNPLTKEGFELGRKLFYDGRLSIDGNYPCASCHQQVAVFGTYEHDRSHGYNDSHTLRNAPPLFNLAWQKELHWDGEYKSLFSEAVHPITTRTEMAGNFQQIIQRLYADATYRQMFRKAFGSSLVSKDRILAALAQFTGSITSYNSKYDKVKRGEALFTLPEQNGYFIYQQKCAACHPEPLFTDYSYRNIGLPVDNELKDFGRMRITGRAEDSLKFKVPSLRNVNMTANYMHDGRFNTLMQVLNHYSSGIQNSTTLDPLLVNRIPMTTTEKTELVSFLKTLSDSTMLTDIRYKKPD